MATRQYVGARYVPKFANPIQWDKNRIYEPLEMVTYLNNTYTSKKPVPQNIDISNTEYWVLSANYNAQVEQYRQEVANISTTIDTKIDAAENELNNKFTTLEEEVNSQLEMLSEVVDSKLTGAMTYDMETQRRKFVSGVLPIIADYIARAYGGNCVSYPDPSLQKIVFVYDNNKTYAGWLGRPTGANTYVGTDTREFNGVNYPVMYLDCSTFNNLLTCGRDYTHTLNYFTNNGGDTSIDYPSTAFKELIWLCSERTPTYDDDWTFDWAGNTITPNMLRLMDTSGNPGVTIQTYTGNKIKDEQAIANLKTGDMLFGGLNSSANYKSIVHCAMYIKSLEELNNVAGGRGYKTYNGNTDNQGYIVEVGNAISGDYIDVLRITTLEQFLTTYDAVYSVAPVSNINTSSRKRMFYTREYTCWRFRANYSPTFNAIDNVQFSVPNVNKRVSTRTSNVSLTMNTDLNAVFDDYAACASSAITASLVNKPDDVTIGMVILKNYTPSWTGDYRIQELLNAPLAGTSETVGVYRRYCNSAGNWSAWAKV